MNARLCSNFKTDGTPCRAVAITGQPRCFFHQRLHKRFRSESRIRCVRVIRLGPLTDRQAIALALSRVVQAIASGSLNLERAAALLERIRQASDGLPDSPQAATSTSIRPAKLSERQTGISSLSDPRSHSMR